MIRASATARQSDLLRFLKSYIAEHDGIAPTYDEMKDAIGLSSKSGIHRLLFGLEERGLIKRIINRARCIEVCDVKGLETYSTTALIAELARRGEMNRRAA